MNTKDEKNMNFEDAMAELEDIASRLSEGEIALDESIKLFERGIKLKKFCSGKLESSRKKIKVLTEGPEGLSEEDFQ